MSTEQLKGIALVADKRSISDVCQLAKKRPHIVAIKAHPKWLFDLPKFEEVDALRNSGLAAIIDTQFTGISGNLELWMPIIARRLEPKVMTVARMNSVVDLEDIARQRDKCAPLATLAVTAYLPEYGAPEHIDEYMGELCENLRRIGNMGVYCAANDIANIDTSDVLTIVAGISLHGQTYGDKQRGVSTLESARALGADVILAGSVLNPDPTVFLNAYAPRTSVR